MNYLTETKTRRFASLLSAGALLAGGIGAPVLLAAGTADAATCSPSTGNASCTMTGTLDLTPGTLTLEAPATLTWAGGTLVGLDKNLVDATDDSLTVIDARGTNTGWNLTASATQFTGTTSSSDKLTNTYFGTGGSGSDTTDTFLFNGSTSDESSTARPSNACVTGSTCTPPTDGTDTLTYPVPLTTAASAPTPWVIYNADASTGEGTTSITPVGWWLNVPGDVTYDTYTSTITLTVSTGPAVQAT